MGIEPILKVDSYLVLTRSPWRGIFQLGEDPPEASRPCPRVSGPPLCCRLRSSLSGRGLCPDQI